ncbi:MAG: sodium:proton antiporter [Verrucomicrobia bacterium]|nr:MAG: sodium:proton antiporter [Verrucomicrobiota bacterium]
MLPNFGPATGEPNPAIMLPFGILLLAIGFGPLIARYHWERHYHQLCVALTGVVCAYELFVIHQSARVLDASIDYVTFMVVVGSFFVVSGGIHLRVRAPSSPARNTLFLFVGAVLANLIGTIGASMLLIRPWITMNKSRVAPMHIAFFIFLVSNIGGALLPVGPPLFLGFLKGVPFWWTVQHCWREWLITIGIVLLIFFVLDSINLHASRNHPHESDLTSWRCDGAHNFIFLFVILAALVAMPASWREPVVVLAALGSYLATPKRIRDANNFTFAPLKEVGWLFLGIFGTMIPVLEFMENSAGRLGLNSDLTFYWATGMLSALLDNAPTYLGFFAAAVGLYGLDINDSSHVARFIGENGRELIAVSLGATFFGALTYIGNAPNLLVKTIAEHARVPTPGFVEYIWKFALPILLPAFALVSISFFSR